MVSSKSEKPDPCSAFDEQEPAAEAVDRLVSRIGAMFALEVDAESAVQTAAESASNQIETQEPTRTLCNA